MTDFFRSLHEKVAPRHTALLVIDMQTGYWPPRGEEHTGSEILPALLPFIDAARQASVPVAYIRNSFSPWVNQPPWYEAWESIRAGGHEGYLIEGTPGVDVMEPLAPAQGELVLNKHFWNVFAHSPMDLVLRSRKIKTVLLTGGGVLGAIESTGKDAVVRGYYSVLVTDCIWPTEGPVRDVGLGYLSKRVGAPATSQEVIECWKEGHGLA
jgi:nicotinamidase-related amidase